MTAPRLRNVPPRLASVDVRVAQAARKTADPHYQTAEHVAWRTAVIQRSGGYCQGIACKRPGRSGQRLFADHVEELRDGGKPFDLANGTALCGACHTAKTIAVRACRMARPT